jgi:hypothetical protein
MDGYPEDNHFQHNAGRAKLSSCRSPRNGAPSLARREEHAASKVMEWYVIMKKPPPFISRVVHGMPARQTNGRQRGKASMGPRTYVLSLSLSLSQKRPSSPPRCHAHKHTATCQPNPLTPRGTTACASRRAGSLPARADSPAAESRPMHTLISTTPSSHESQGENIPAAPSA